MDRHQSLKALLIANEGDLPHMYLDTVGRVTVGVGHMIPSVEEAQKLSFVVRTSQDAAAPEQIAADYNSVSQQTPGMLAARYLPFTALDMAAAAIDALLDSDIARMEDGVRASFPDYATYPAPAQDALLDMAFNLGVSGLIKKFPHLTAAAQKQDWATCAAQCHRNGISDARNEATKQLFLSAAGGESATGSQVRSA